MRFAVPAICIFILIPPISRVWGHGVAAAEPPQPGWVLRFGGVRMLFAAEFWGGLVRPPALPVPGTPGDGRGRREAPTCGHGAGHGALSLCWGALPWLGLCEGFGGSFSGALCRWRCPKPRWLPGLRDLWQLPGLWEVFGEGKGVKPEGCLVAGEFNMGTGGGGGGPGGKSFPKCARRAWVGCQTLVYFVLLGKRWGTGVGGKCFCIPRPGCFGGRTVCSIAGAVGGSGREFCWSVCLSFGVKTKQEASVFRCRIHTRARPRRVLRPQFCLMGSFLSFFFSLVLECLLVCLQSTSSEAFCSLR